MSLTADKIDTAQAIAALQSLALGGLKAWLDADLDLPAPDQAGLDDLAASLADEKDLTQSQKSSVTRLSRRFLMSAPPKWSLAQKRWIADNLGAGLIGGTLAAIKDMFRRVFGPARVPFNPVAPILADAIAQEAFAAPAFRRIVSGMLRQHARARVILYPDNGKPAVLGVPTLWAAAAQGTRAISQATVQGRLTRKASQTTKTTDWAGFWDSYLFQQARARNFDVPDADLTLHLTPQPDTPPQFRTSWRDDMPGYAPQLIENTL